jgi:hypothetical protein
MNALRKQWLGEQIAFMSLWTAAVSYIILGIKNPISILCVKVTKHWEKYKE